MATIKKYKKKDGSIAYMFNLYIGIDPNTGKKKRTTRRGFKTVKEAKLSLAKLQLDISNDGVSSVNEMRYEEVYDLWIKQHKLSIKPTTYRAIKSKFKTILQKFGHLQINKISHIYCQEVVNEWADKFKTFQDYKIQANQVFKYALKFGIISKNPMEFVALPRLKKDIFYNLKEKNYFSKEELEFFLEQAEAKLPYKDYFFFYLLSYTGMRKGEALALQWQDIDVEDKSITIQKTLDMSEGINVLQTTKTKKSLRTIEVGENTIDALLKWRTIQYEQYKLLGLKQDVSSPIFNRFDEREHKMKYWRLARPNDLLNSFLKRYSDLPHITVHGFRHTHASLLFELGHSIKSVQDRLGHSDIQTTLNIYTHLTKEKKEKVADSFEKFIKS